MSHLLNSASSHGKRVSGSTALNNNNNHNHLPSNQLQNKFNQTIVGVTSCIGSSGNNNNNNMYAMLYQQQ
jgi:hypothetical protein